MGTVPTNQTFKKITSNNITDDYIQLVRGSDKTVLLWVDALGVIHAPGGISGAVPGGSNNDVQFNDSTAFGGNSGFTYDNQSGVIATNTTAPTFAAPTITPATAGSTTWGYTIVARQGTNNIAISAQGTTTTGTASLNSTDKNVITWAAIPGATEYDVFCSTSPGVVNSGYLTTVSATTYTDTGAVTASGTDGIEPNEAGFPSIQPGAHFGNMTYKDIWAITNGPNLLSFLTGAGYVNSFVKKTSRPAAYGDLAYSPAGFIAGQFIAQSESNAWSPLALNAIAISNTDVENGTTGGTFVAISNSNDSTVNVSWLQGSSNAGVNFNPGNVNFVIGAYGTAQNYATPALGKTISIMTDFYGEAFLGTKSSQIDLFAAFYASANASGQTTAGAGAKTASFYSTDTGAGATDFSFYSAGGNNYFGGSATNVLTIANAIPATNVANQNSPIVKISGTYWTGSASADDTYIIQNLINSGATPGTTLDFSHAGSGPGGSFAFHGPVNFLSSLTTGNITQSSGATFNQTAGNGDRWTQGSSTELLTLSTSGATTDTSSNLLPANSIIQAVVVRITQTISGGSTPTTWSIGDATTAARFVSTGNALTANTTAVGLNHQQGGVSTNAAGPVQTAAAKVRVTLDQTPGQGQIRITVFYSTFTAPTS